MEFADVPVPADQLWDVVADLPAMVGILSMVVGLEFDNNKTAPLATGTRFRETREFEGTKYTLYKTVTRLEAANPKERYLSFGVGFRDPRGKPTKTVNTSTLTVQHITKTTSRLILTVAFEWHGAKEVVGNLICSPCIKRKVRVHMQKEVECYCNAAVARKLAESESGFMKTNDFEVARLLLQNKKT